MHKQKQNGKRVGTFTLDRQFGPVGRIKRASGTSSKKMYTKLNNMLTNLWENGRLDILRDIKSGNIHVMEAYDYWRVHQGGMSRYF